MFNPWILHLSVVVVQNSYRESILKKQLHETFEKLANFSKLMD